MGVSCSGGGADGAVLCPAGHPGGVAGPTDGELLTDGDVPADHLAQRAARQLPEGVAVGDDHDTSDEVLGLLARSPVPEEVASLQRRHPVGAAVLRLDLDGHARLDEPQIESLQLFLLDLVVLVLCPQAVVAHDPLLAVRVTPG